MFEAVAKNYPNYVQFNRETYDLSTGFAGTNPYVERLDARHSLMRKKNTYPGVRWSIRVNCHKVTVYSVRIRVYQYIYIYIYIQIYLLYPSKQNASSGHARHSAGDTSHIYMIVYGFV